MSGLTDVGNLMCLYIDEIAPGEGTDAPEFLIKATAKLLNQDGGRNWIPVIVKETGEDKYEVIGNSFIYAVAEEAGLEKVWCIIADASKETAEITKVLAGEVLPKVNLCTASRDEIMAALQYLIERPGSELKGVKLAIATNRIEEAPRQHWSSFGPIANLKCGITKGKKLNALKEVFYLAPEPKPKEIKEVKVVEPSTKSPPKEAKDSALLNELTLPELKKIAKERNISGYSKMRKPELVEVLSQ